MQEKCASRTNPNAVQGFFCAIKWRNFIETSCSPASGLLDTFVAVQNTFEQLRHQRLQVIIGGLADNPVGIAAQCPAGDGTHQGLLVRQTLHEMGYELRQVWDHALHTAWRQG